MITEALESNKQNSLVILKIAQSPPPPTLLLFRLSHY